MPMKQLPRRRLPADILIAVLAALVACGLVALRARIVDVAYGAYTGCHGCFWLPVTAHDGRLVALLLALLGASFLIRRGWLQLLLALPAAALLLIMALDVAAFASLTQRLHLGDLLRFGDDGAAVAQFARGLLDSPQAAWWLAATLAVLVAAIGVCWPRRRRPRIAAGFAAAALLVAVFGFWPAAGRLLYVHPESYRNVVELALAATADHRYSAAFRAGVLDADSQRPRQCEAAPASDKPDVILLLVESLSAYHSKLLGGPLNVTPELDRLAQANHYFTHFYANGFTTNGGRVALYTGRTPLPPPGYSTTLPLDAYRFTTDSLPDMAHRAGYAAWYFTTGDLGFLDSDQWLAELGFDHIEGAEAPFYAGMQRGGFNAASDHALFARFLNWLDHEETATPYLASLLTVNSHPPFVHPETRKVDERATFRYVDAQIGWFYRQLEQRGFFDNGVLLITGDHRSMTPLRPGEYANWGVRALARVPMVVIGDVDMPKRVDAAFQQIGFPASFAHLAGLAVCRDPIHGSFLRATPQAPAAIVHASGAARNRVDMYFGDEEAALILDGDDSRWVGPKPPWWQQLAGHIHALRIREAELAAEP